MVVVEGEVTADDERRALQSFGADPDLDPTADLLVDRRRAISQQNPQDLKGVVAESRHVFPEADARPRMAIVAPQPLDFGLGRMIQLGAAGEPPHDLQVFETLDAACAWLGVPLVEVESMLESDLADS